MTNDLHSPWLRRFLTALGLAAALLTVAPMTSAQAQQTARAARAQTAASPDGVVNIQTATAEQLQLLPGIGPSKAEAIVAHRERRAFRRVRDILRVRGIGRATYRRLQSMLTVDGPTTMNAPASASSDDE